jgi:hypothetical protein
MASRDLSCNKSSASNSPRKRTYIDSKWLNPKSPTKAKAKKDRVDDSSSSSSDSDIDLVADFRANQQKQQTVNNASSTNIIEAANANKNQDTIRSQKEQNSDENDTTKPFWAKNHKSCPETSSSLDRVDNDNDNEDIQSRTKSSTTSRQQTTSNNVIELLSDEDDQDDENKLGKAQNNVEGKPKLQTSNPKKRNSNQNMNRPFSFNVSKPKLQSGLVLQEDLSEETTNPVELLHVQEQLERHQNGQPPKLYHDTDFETIPSSIDGANKRDVPKCRCSPALLAKLSCT